MLATVRRPGFVLAVAVAVLMDFTTGRSDAQDKKKLGVLLVNGRPAKKPIEQASGYLEVAINPFGMDPRADGIRTTVVSVAGFADFKPDELTRWDCILLCDVPHLSAAAARALEHFVRGGGGMIVCLGPQVDLKATDKELYRDGKGLLPARLLKRRKAPQDKPFALSFPKDAFTHPPLSAFAEDKKVDPALLLRQPRFREFVQVDSPPAEAKARTLLTFDVGAIAMVEWRPFADIKGCGRVVLVTTSMDLEWNNWPSSVSFVVVVQELVRFVGRPR